MKEAPVSGDNDDYEVITAAGKISICMYEKLMFCLIVCLLVHSFLWGGGGGVVPVLCNTVNLFLSPSWTFR